MNNRTVELDGRIFFFSCPYFWNSHSLVSAVFRGSGRCRGSEKRGYRLFTQTVRSWEVAEAWLAWLSMQRSKMWFPQMAPLSTTMAQAQGIHIHHHHCFGNPRSANCHCACAPVYFLLPFLLGPSPAHQPLLPDNIPLRRQMCINIFPIFFFINGLLVCFQVFLKNHYIQCCHKHCNTHASSFILDFYFGIFGWMGLLSTRVPRS